jgi:hypothetical protein
LKIKRGKNKLDNQMIVKAYKIAKEKYSELESKYGRCAG